MCGIVGYVGNNKAEPILLSGLEKLEYRGYDSAGIAVLDGEKLNIIKTKGALNFLKEELEKQNGLIGCVGIGHTRWATHGKPCVVNAHPHFSQNKKFAIVHNGIIENYSRLKAELKKEHIHFSSETDSEVIAQLLEVNFNGDFWECAKKTIKQLEGSFAALMLSEAEPNLIIAAKKATPLVIGIGKDENYIASDITALLKYTRSIIRLHDGEIAKITKNNVEIFDFEGKLLNKKAEYIDWDISAAEKCGYEHFMIKEIMEQPKALKDTIIPRIQNGKIKFGDVCFTSEYLENLNKISIVACGSAFHVGIVAKYVFEKMLRIPVEVDIASEFRYREPLVDENTLVIVISQSGETADTLAALREAKKLGARTLSIVNVVGSAIAIESDDVIYTWAGPEIAVATTKAYSTQLAVIYLLAGYMAEKLEKFTPDEYLGYINAIESLPDFIEKILKDTTIIQELAKEFIDSHNTFFLGRHFDYAVALEGSLKLKEISYIHSEAYAAGELKHGTISLIEEGLRVVALATNQELVEKMISNIKEVKARGAFVLSLTTEKNKDLIESVSDKTIFIPEVLEILKPSLSVVVLQVLSYYVALEKKCEIDKPRNLAKSVTVE